MKTIILILFLFSTACVSAIDDDCFCPLVYGDGGYFSKGQIYVDTCNQNYECSYTNFPFYFKTFEYLIFDDNGLSDLDTGYIDFKNLPLEAQLFSNQLNEFDDIFSIKSIYREIAGDIFSFKVEINTYQTEESIDSSIVSILNPVNIFYPQVVYLSDVDDTRNEKILTLADGILENEYGILESVTAYDLYGREIERFERINSNSLNLSDLKGAFILQVKTNNTTHTIKYFSN